MISVGREELIAAYFWDSLKKNSSKIGRELLYNLWRKHPHDEVVCGLWDREMTVKICVYSEAIGTDSV